MNNKLQTKVPTTMNIGKGLDAVLSPVAAIALVAMMLHTVAHAVLRSTFSSPLYGTNEIVAYWYMPVIVLAGLVSAQWRKEHISVSIIFDQLKPINQFEYTVFNNVLGIILCLGFAWFGLNEALGNLAIDLSAGVTSIVVWPVTFLVPLVFILLALLFSVDIAQNAKEKTIALQGEEALREVSASSASAR